MPATTQSILAFPSKPDYSPGRFAVGACNQLALDWVSRYPDWPGAVRGLILTGEVGCGKSHLASMWAATTQAETITSLAPSFTGMGGVDSLAANQCYVLDGLAVGDAWPDEAVFLCLERFSNRDTGTPSTPSSGRGGLLILADSPPANMPWRRADVASRLAAMSTAAITAPDDKVLAAVLQKLADDRGLLLGDGVISHLIKNMECRFAEAAHLIDQLDGLSMRVGKRVTLPLAKQVLPDPSSSPTLF